MGSVRGFLQEFPFAWAGSGEPAIKLGLLPQQEEPRSSFKLSKGTGKEGAATPQADLFRHTGQRRFVSACP